MLDIDLIEARANAATPGPWSEAWEGEIHAHPGLGWEMVLRVPEADDRPADCAFVAHAREDIPALIAEVRRMRAVVDASVKLYEAEDYSDSVRDMRYPYSVAYHARKLAYAAWRDAVSAYKAQEDS